MNEDVPGLLYDMRARQALLVAALRQMGGELLVTRRQATETGEYEVTLHQDEEGIRACLRKLKPA